MLHVRLNRPAKRNAVSDALVAQLHTCFVNLPEATRAVVLSGAGDHFCAGLDLAEVSERSVAEGIVHSRSWHAAFQEIQFGRVPVVAVLHGAVVGGGLELAAACHVRVAEASAFYGLPEGQRGLFVGGGGSARIPRLIGAARMTDMMLTGRVYDAAEGLAIGVSQYVVGAGEGLAKANGAGRADRRQRAALQFRGDARLAANRRHGAGPGPLRRIADGGDRLGRRGGQDARPRLPRRPGGEGAEDVSEGAAAGGPGARPRYRPLPLGGSLEASFDRRADGSTLVVSREPLAPYPKRLTDRFLEWAERDPARTLVAKREPKEKGGDWRRLSYGEALQSARAIAQALLDLRLSAERPVVILSDNDIEHLQLALGAMLAGVPYASISPAYSLVSQDFGKLRHIVDLLTPGLVFASGPAYAKAIAAVVPAETPVVLTEGEIAGRATRSFAELLATRRRRRSMPPTPRSTPTRSPSSCSRRARPSCPRA